MNDERLPRQTYLRELKEINTENSWGKKVKDLLEQNGFGYVWLNQGVVFKNSLIKSLRQRLVDQYWQNWNSKLQEKQRYSTYRKFKNNHNSEAYLKAITITKFRKIFTKLRLGILDIKINKSHYDTSVDVSCPLCKCDTENEIHLLFHCPGYVYLRNKYITKHWPSTQSLSLKEILGTQEEHKIKDLAMFTFYAMKRREYLLSAH